MKRAIKDVAGVTNRDQTGEDSPRSCIQNSQPGGESAADEQPLLVSSKASGGVWRLARRGAYGFDHDVRVGSAKSNHRRHQVDDEGY
jgi:hypothetical protein